ncbi:MAG TPA: hypothetical protein PL048_07840 [Leptospiraceae bacterium]|nr:hypothetical protein [Leptospiraceae bacterium]HNN04823.1 hypothetical protein [Leptospiraceae bacterium]HNO21707.1 hypothetical protein [Leptospiraceae bacterium]
MRNGFLYAVQIFLIFGCSFPGQNTVPSGEANFRIQTALYIRGMEIAQTQNKSSSLGIWGALPAMISSGSTRGKYYFKKDVHSCVRKILSFPFLNEMDIYALYLSGTAPKFCHLPEAFFFNDIHPGEGKLMN